MEESFGALTRKDTASAFSSFQFPLTSTYWEKPYKILGNVQSSKIRYADQQSTFKIGPKKA